jgi:hypothetical protein
VVLALSPGLTRVMKQVHPVCTLGHVIFTSVEDSWWRNLLIQWYFGEQQCIQYQWARFIQFYDFWHKFKSHWLQCTWMYFDIFNYFILKTKCLVLLILFYDDPIFILRTVSIFFRGSFRLTLGGKYWDEFNVRWKIPNMFSWRCKMYMYTVSR